MTWQITVKLLAEDDASSLHRATCFGTCIRLGDICFTKFVAGCKFHMAPSKSCGLVDPACLEGKGLFSNHVSLFVQAPFLVAVGTVQYPVKLKDKGSGSKSCSTFIGGSHAAPDKRQESKLQAPPATLP